MASERMTAEEEARRLLNAYCLTSGQKTRLASRITAALSEARRQGAEDLRERAAQAVLDLATTPRTYVRADTVAAAIRALPAQEGE